jgi:cathepsin A (carboxypeptidase C)
MAKNTEYAHTHGLISKEQKVMLDKKYKKKGTYSGLNWEIYQLCGCYMANTGQFGDPCFDPVLLYLNRDDVREAIHAPKGVQIVNTWSEQVSENYTPFINNSYLSKVQSLLKPSAKQKVQIVSGLNDAKDCNFLGTEAWLDLLKGKAAKDFNATKPAQWKNKSNDVIGFYQDGGTLSWLKVLNAGHLAVNDQPLIIEKILEKALE